MKYLFITLFFTHALLAASPSLENAPMEWLITQTIQLKVDEDEHLHEDDELIKRIFQNVIYHVESDELILSSSKEMYDLRVELINFLKEEFKELPTDPLYISWKNEPPSRYKISIDKFSEPSEGHYFFNHVHTNISQDNQSLKLLKLSPERTFKIIEKFLEKREATGVVSFTDHDTDKAFDIVKDMNSPVLQSLRGIEWGGRTHMGLVGIKKDWELLSNGRDFSGEESIIKSRSSEGFRIINHPNRKTPFPYTSWLDVDGVEVWNTIMENLPYSKIPLKKSNNRDALKQWTDAMKGGQRHTAVGGSDFHFIIPCLRDRSLHYPANFIPSDDPDKTEENLMKGNVSFLTRPTSPKMNLKARPAGASGWAGMGDHIGTSGEVEVLLTADFNDVKKRMGSVCYNTISTFHKLLTFWKKRKWEIRFYNLEGKVLARKELKPKRYGPRKSFQATFKFPVDGVDIVRAELWSINKKSKQVDLLGATNPVYFNN